MLEEHGIGPVLHHLVSSAEDKKNRAALMHLIKIGSSFNAESELRKNLWTVVWNRERGEDSEAECTASAMKEVDSLLLGRHHPSREPELQSRLLEFNH